MINFVVDEATAGQRVDRALRMVAPGVDRATAMRLLRDGRISVNSAKATLKTVVARGDAVTARVDPARLVAPPPKVGTRKEARQKLAQQMAATPTAHGFSVLFLDAHLCVVDKRAGMATHPAAGVEKGTSLVDAMIAFLAEKKITPERPPAAAGRLDRGTSGVVVMTLSREAEKAMAHAVEGDAVEKEYLALCHGMTQPAFEIDEPLVVAKYTQGAPKVKKLKSAVTRFRTVATGKDASLVLALPETGRMHQIRRHLRMAEHPIVGDGRYGLREDRKATRFFLHAASVELPHPVDGRKLTFRAPLPADFREAMASHGVTYKA
jgi:RluA family pseudouridine synthase